jgi:putative peptidoglycan lipid II flippase
LRRVISGLARLVSGTLLSRAAGMVREMVLAFAFGSDRRMDRFWIAFTVPNLVREILGERVMESTFLPAFKTLQDEEEGSRAWRLATSVTSTILLLFVPVVFLGIWLAPQAVDLLAPGFSAEDVTATAAMTRVLFAFIVFIGCAAVLGAVLQAQERFGYYGAAPAAFNIGIVVAVLVAYKRIGLMAAAYGVVLGAAAQFLIQYLALGPAGRDRKRWRFRPRIDHRDPNYRRVVRLSGPIVVESLAIRAALVSDRMVGSLLPEGSIAALGYSFRLCQLPFALVALGLGRVVLPILVEQNTLQDRDAFLRTFRVGLRLLFLMILPAVVLLLVLREPLVRVVYQRGHFTAEHTAMVSWALLFHSLGLLGMGAMSMIARVFYALQETRTPVVVTFVRSGVNIVLNFTLAFTFLRHGGVALAGSLSFSIGAILLYRLLRRRLARAGIRLDLGTARRALVGYVAAAGVMALVARATYSRLSLLWPQPGAARTLLLMGLTAAAGLFVFALLCVLLDPAIIRTLRRGLARIREERS